MRLDLALNKSRPQYISAQKILTLWCTGWAWNCQIIFRCASIHGRAGFILLLTITITTILYYLILWCSLAPGLLFCIYIFNGMRCKPLCHFCLLADDKFRLSPLFTNRKINIGMDMGKNPYKQIVLALFFKMSKNMKRWRDVI